MFGISSRSFPRALASIGLVVCLTLALSMLTGVSKASAGSGSARQCPREHASRRAERHGRRSGRCVSLREGARLRYATGTTAGVGGDCTSSVGSDSLWATFGPESWPGPCWRPYSDESPYNQPLPPPSQTPLDPDSGSIVQFMLNQTWNGNSDFSDVPVSNDPAQDEPSQWGHPLYWAHYGDPSYSINDVGYPCTGVDGQSSCPKTVLIPNGAQHALGGDGHLAVVQPDGTEVDFWQVKNSNPISGGGTLTVSEYGALPINGSGCCGQATAAMQGLDAGVIRAQELEEGSINHALIVAVDCSNGSHVYPAAGNGAPCSDTTNAPAIGQRFQLNMTDAQVDAMAIPMYRKVILKAMIHYGFYIADTGGGPWDLAFEPALDYTSFGAPNPFVVYAQQAGLTTGNSYTFTFNGGVDWSKLQVVNPCYTAGTC